MSKTGSWNMVLKGRCNILVQSGPRASKSAGSLKKVLCKNKQMHAYIYTYIYTHVCRYLKILTHPQILLACVLLPAICQASPQYLQYQVIFFEIVRLPGHMRRIFPETLHQRIREEKLKTRKRDCPGQFLCGSKGFLSENSK